MPQRKVRADAAASAALNRHFEEFYKGTDGREVSTTMAFVRHAGQAAARSGNRQVDRSDRSRRSAHLRHGVAVPASRHLLQLGPDVRAGRHGHAPLLQGSEERPDSGRRHHRSRLDVLVHRRRTAYANHGINTIPFFIYYSMFGFQRIGDLIWAAADMRVPRIPAGRHGRTHNAGRRRLAASGRPQPCAGAARVRICCATIRPLRMRSPSSFRTASGACNRSGIDLLLPHCTNEPCRCPRCRRATFAMAC